VQTGCFQSKVRKLCEHKDNIENKVLELPWTNLILVFILVHGPKALYKNHNLPKDTEAYEDNMGHLVMHLLLHKSCYAADLNIYANVVNGTNQVIS